MTPGGKIKTGDVFGKLTVLSFVGVTPVYRKHVWEASCSCGNVVIVKSQELLSGDTKSCGCLHRAATIARNKAAAIHRRHGTPEYRSWLGAKDRCCNPNSKDAKNYSLRGITMCARWVESFDNFFADMGPRPPGCSLDRIDNDGPYSPENCRWADAAGQADNRRTTRHITENGRTMSISGWAREIGITDCAVRRRVKTTGSVYGHAGRTRKGRGPQIST